MEVKHLNLLDIFIIVIMGCPIFTKIFGYKKFCNAGINQGRHKLHSSANNMEEEA
ncbi:hypothetical protein COLO4_05706 [Corchorus olitorius]|uniref:Uncharacterized protein n=1 Tax=Corchorus olitorius TaxID=93759 RepID=A0A1R3KQ92_9ROSI|nr:hypothetical protein COLO4_05706 [Corchorus olitorius]